jgi:non-specific serine/threonine protein kinase/serine/threonine-protein kinase
MAMARHVDEVCVRFERAWNAGERPVIEEYLGDTSEPARSRLLSELVAVEVACRRRQGDKVQADEYQRRFPNLDSAFLAGLCQTPVSEAPGTRIGPYKLLQQLGEGGMGVVFLAEQAEPVRRQVALKVIKAGLDSGRVLARFEQERQALALMDHPHIAKVFDAGTTAESDERGGRRDEKGTGDNSDSSLIPHPSSLRPGRPYFVMELVKGLPFTKYCDQEQLTPRERLELFIPVCQAVQHAHQKGIIHRDLKPSNVLIGLYDGRPVPKVIDFGVAKATAQRLTERTLFTEVGCLVGTLEYMAPEQAEVNNLDIDTRADIYSLGVLLYELLTGSPPFTGRQLRSMAYHEMLRVIREVEPPKPSTKLSSSAELVSIAARRKLEPKKLTKLVHGDLDWIVMKCLAKERSRRYETATGLASDLQRYLCDEPVLAGPPSRMYRLKKFLRRNRGGVVAAGVILLCLVGGMIGTSWGLLAERRARDSAEKRLGQVQKANDILGSVFHDLDPDAEEHEGKPLRVLLGERLGGAVKQLDAEAIGDTLAVARVQAILGRSLKSLGYWDEAEGVLETAERTLQNVLGAEDVYTLTTRLSLVEVYTRQGKYEQAESMCLSALRDFAVKLGPDHPLTLESKQALAVLYMERGKYDGAEPLLHESLQASTAASGPNRPATLRIKGHLTDLYVAQGKYALAERLHNEVLQAQTARLGADHKTVLVGKARLAGLYGKQGKYEQAERLNLEALQGLKAKVGADHPDTLATKGNLGQLYWEQGKYDQAEPLFRQVLQTATANLEPGHPTILTDTHNLAALYEAQGKHDLAERLFEEVLHGRTGKLGPNHPQTLITKAALAGVYRSQAKYEHAEHLYKDVLQASTVRLGADHPSTLTYHNSLASLYWSAGKYDQAIAAFEQVLELR